MDLGQGIRTTGAVRDFRDQPVPDEVVVEVLDDARFAPSGGNRQPWRVALVKDPAIRRRLADMMQATWDEYIAAGREGQVPFNLVDYRRPAEITHRRNPLLDGIESVPAVLVVAADLRQIAATDSNLDRPTIVPGASIYPFCWNALLSARAHGLGGVLTTFLSRTEPEAATVLGLPADHAVVAMLFLGYPVHQPTRLRRSPVSSFASIDRFDGRSLGNDSSS